MHENIMTNKNIMTKKQIEQMFNNMKQMFNNMKQSCECVKSLYDQNFYNIEQTMKQIDEYTNDYMYCLNVLLLFDMIDDEIYDYAYELLNEFEIKFFE